MGTQQCTQNGYRGFYSNQAVMGIISVMRVYTLQCQQQEALIVC